MILDIPIVYKAEVVCGRKRNAEAVTLAASIPCELREAGADEAPVAMWWTEEEGWPETCLRAHEGALYAPMVGPVDRWGRGAAGTGLDAPASAAPARRWNPALGEPAEDEEPRGPLDAGPDGAPPELPHGTPQLVSAAAFGEAMARGAARISYRTVSADKPPAADHELGADGVLRSLRGAPNPQQVRRITASALETKRAEYVRAMENLLSVDGVLFRRVEAPVYLLKLGRGHPTMHATFADRPPALGEHAFTPQGYAAMRQAWREMSRNPDRPERDPEEGYAYGLLPPPDVERPDLLPDIDESAFHLGRDVDAALAHLASFGHGSSWGRYEHAPTVAHYPREVALAFAGLRDARAAGAPPFELAERLAALGEVSRSHGTLSAVVEHARVACARSESALSDEFALGAL